MPQPLVSVLFITYNHQNYVEQALGSILSQETSFPFEIVIGDDCSTDGTREFIEQAAQQHKDRIRLSNPVKNIGAAENFIQLFNACVRGGAKYIAYLEGDDYWIDKNKLQKQVDFLEKNPGYELSCHPNYELNNGKMRLFDRRPDKKKQSFTLVDYLLSLFFHTSSIVFRAADIFPGWYKEVYAGDNFMILLLATKGDIYYFTEPMSVYRIHSRSISNSFYFKQLGENYARYLLKFNELTERKYEKEIKMIIKKWELNTNWNDRRYFRKVKYFFRNFVFYCRNYQRFFSIRLFFKYLLPTSVIK
jgi:glycosyltransferase involved in cell wall biosynthesis